MELTKEIIEKGLELCKQCDVYKGLSDCPCNCDINGKTCYEIEIEHKMFLEKKSRQEELNKNYKKTDWSEANVYMNKI